MLCASAITLLASTAIASVPGQVNYQGLLLDDLGDPITGPVDMVFSLYADPSGGSALWIEAHNDVDVLDGVYEVELGSFTPLTPALLAGAHAVSLMQGVWDGAGWVAHWGNVGALILVFLVCAAASTKVFRWE